MKKKLRKLRKIREMAAHRKGGFSKSYKKKWHKGNVVVKRKGEKVRILELGSSIFFDSNYIYYKFNLAAKAKKRGGKNR